MAGPLTGLKVIEFAGIGPGPYAAMLLSDLGADVVRIDRPNQSGSPNEIPNRGRRSLVLDLKNTSDIETCLRLIEKADVLIEGLRPGVMERLGLGPETALSRNPRLIYGRMTGFGQSGPLAKAAGHDINYIAITGALEAIGPEAGPPVPPLNLVGDYGGGAMFLVFGITSALYERSHSGRGQVVDAAIVDGTASLMSIFHWLEADAITSFRRGQNYLGGAAPFYGCYECADGKFVSVGAIEPQFFELLVKKIGLEVEDFGDRFDPASWTASRERVAGVFRTKTRDEWTALLEGSDACFAPVLALDEAAGHPHMQAREVFVEVDGLSQPAPAPRFSRTPGAIQSPPVLAAAGGDEALSDWGVERA